MHIATQKEAAELIVKVLRKAKTRLMNHNDELYRTYNKEVYLCCAVNRANGYNMESDFVTNYITRTINNQYTFNSWLKDTISQSQYESLSFADFQTLRHKWVNKMIRELTAQYINVQ